MKLFVIVFLKIIYFACLITFEWTSLTTLERSCNYPKNDFSFFGVPLYSDNAFLITNLNYNSNTEGKINVYMINNEDKLKKVMHCKYWSSSSMNQDIGMQTFGFLFCDLLYENKIYQGIQLLNDGEINFSGNYDKKIMVCNKYNYNNGNDEETDKNNINNKESKEKKEEKEEKEEKEKEKQENENTIENNDDNKNSKESNENNNNNNNKEDGEQNYNANEYNDNNIYENDNNENKDKTIIEKEKESETKEEKVKRKNILGISTGAAVGIGVGCLAAAGIGASILIKNSRSSRRVSKNNSGSSIKYTQTEKESISNQNKNMEQTKNQKMSVKHPKLIIVGIILFGIAGIVIPIPLIRVETYDELFYNNTSELIQDESVYLQRQGGDAERHKNHMCNDPRNLIKYPRKNPEKFGCPISGTSYIKCWYCKNGCAIGSVFHILGIIPNEENVRKYVNGEADVDWKKLEFEKIKEPQEDCVAEMKSKRHYVHIIKVYGDFVDIYDPNGGYKSKQKREDFWNFRKKRNNINQ